MVWYIFIFLGLLHGQVFADSDFQQSVDGFLESLDDLGSIDISQTSKEGISYEGKDPVYEPSVVKKVVQLLGDEYDFDITPNVWERALEELQKINTELKLHNVTSAKGQVTNEVIQTIDLVVSLKDCSEESCQFSCKIEFHSNNKDGPVQNTCGVNLDKREKRNTKTLMKKKVDPVEADVLANFAVNTLDMFDVDNNKRVVKQIISANKELTQSDCTPINSAKSKSIEDGKRVRRESFAGGFSPADVTSDFVQRLANFSVIELKKRSNCGDCMVLDKVIQAESQVVAGINVHMKLQLRDIKNTTTQICDVFVWEKEWENFRELTDFNCSAFKQIDGLLGGYKSVDVNDDFVKKMAEFSMTRVKQEVNNPNVQMTKILSAATQVVSGKNTKITMEVADGNKANECSVIVYDQPWTNTREVTQIQCDPVKTSRKKRNLSGQLVGGYSPMTDQDEIAKYAAFSLSQIANNEIVNSPSGVKLVKVKRAEVQVVSGVNIRLDLVVMKPQSNNVFTCVVVIWERSWMNFKEVTDVDCKPDRVMT